MHTSQLRLLGLLCLLLLASTAWMLSSLTVEPRTPDALARPTAGPEPSGSAMSGPTATPLVEREGDDPDLPTEQAPNLALPDKLPELDLPAYEAPKVTAPVEPLGPIDIEGNVLEADARLTIAAIFPGIRQCFLALRQRSTDAEGAIKLTFRLAGGITPGTSRLNDPDLGLDGLGDDEFATCLQAVVSAAEAPVGTDAAGTVRVAIRLTAADARD